jgi:hypothetical protein
MENRVAMMVHLTSIRGRCLLRAPSRAFLSFVPALACVLSFSACGEEGIGKEGDAATPLAPTSPSSVVTDCTEVTTRGEGPTYRISLRLDVGSRIISLFGEDGSKVLAWRYDEAKRLVAKAGYPKPGGSQWDVFQHDYLYDVHGNQVDFRLSYPSSANLEVPSTAETWSGTHFENQYDPSGVLLSSTQTSYGSGAGSTPALEILFRENTAHACERVEYRGAFSLTETRTYDAAGRISRIDAPGKGAGQRKCSTWTKSWTYDDRGRPTLVREWCDPVGPDAEPGRSVTTTYRADGTQRIEVIDSFDDVKPGTAIVTERSASCALIDAWRGGPYNAVHPTTSRCTP